MKDIAKHISPHDIILDIGAYNCELLDYIKPKEYHAVDLTPFKEKVLRVNVSYDRLPFMK